MVKLIKGAAVFAVALYFLSMVMLFFMQDRIVFPAPGASDLTLPPDAKYIEMQAADGTILKHIRFQDEEGAPKLIFFHGNGSLAAYEIARGQKLHEMGFDVLLAEYRGYGENGGKPSSDALKADSLALYDWYKTDDRDWVFLYAHSLGSGIASYLAAQRPIESMVLEAPFSALSDVAADRYPFFPVRALLRHEFNNVQNLAGTEIPIMIIHGDADEVVPLNYGQKLFDSLNPETSSIKILPGVGHNALVGNGSIDLTLEHFIKSF